MMKLIEPEISERFDLDDIRKIREYNSLRHSNMTTEEMIADIREGARIVEDELAKRKAAKYASPLPV